jgi:hypothetical protein
LKLLKETEVKKVKRNPTICWFDKAITVLINNQWRQ